MVDGDDELCLQVAAGAKHNCWVISVQEETTSNDNECIASIPFS
jgi:hypothetical protein